MASGISIRLTNYYNILQHQFGSFPFYAATIG